MKRLAFLIVLACLVPAAAGAQAAGCKSGVHQHGGVTARTFCGPAYPAVAIGAMKVGC